MHGDKTLTVCDFHQSYSTVEVNVWDSEIYELVYVASCTHQLRCDGTRFTMFSLLRIVRLSIYMYVIPTNETWGNRVEYTENQVSTDFYVYSVHLGILWKPVSVDPLYKSLSFLHSLEIRLVNIKAVPLSEKRIRASYASSSLLPVDYTLWIFIFLNSFLNNKYWTFFISTVSIKWTCIKILKIIIY